MKNLVIIGAGGFAREIYDLAYYCYPEDANFKIKGFLSDGPSNIQSLGYPPVLGTVKGYEIQPDDIFFCGIGDVHDRKKTVNLILGRGGKFINLVHPNAVISPSVELGIGVGIKANCVIASDCKIDNYVFLQSSVILGHDVEIGAYSHVNSFSFFAGCAKIGEEVTVNAGAKIVQNIVVENNSTVGMGSVVLRKVKAGTTVFGIPAKRLKYK